MNFKFKVEGDTKLAAQFRGFANAITDYSKAWSRIRENFYKLEERLFGTEGATGSEGKWTALSARYAEWKEKTYPGRPILVLNGWLRQSLTQAGGDNVFDSSPREMTIGTRVPYAGAHYSGVSTKNLPSRKPLDLNKQDTSNWVKLIHEFIIETERSIGL